MAGKKPSALHRGTIPARTAQRNAWFPFFFAEEKIQRAETLPEAAVGSGKSKTSIHPPFPLPGGSLGVLSPAQGTQCAAPGTGPNKARGLGCTGSQGSSQGSRCCPSAEPQHSPGSGPGVAADGLCEENCRVSAHLPPPRGPVCDVTAVTSHHAGPGPCEVRALLSHMALWATTAWLEAARAVLVPVCPWQERFCQGSVRSFCLSGRALGRQIS